MTPADSEPRLRLRGLRARGLAPLDLAVAAGECVAMRGASGAGKTVLLRAIADLDPNDGECFVDGVARASLAAPDWRRRVGYVSATPGFWADRLVDHYADPAAAAHGLERLGLSATLLERDVARLSTGERLRAALVRALEHGPDVLLLDEPTGPLDPDATAAVEAWLAAARADGVAMLWVTHDLHQGRRIATRALVVADGHVRETAP